MCKAERSNFALAPCSWRNGRKLSAIMLIYQLTRSSVRTRGYRTRILQGGYRANGASTTAGERRKLIARFKIQSRSTECFP
jgi:hypothetical protein